MKKLAETTSDAVTNAALIFLSALIARLGWAAGAWVLTRL